MLTRAGVLVAVGSALALATGRILGVTELFVLGAVGAGLIAIAMVWVRRPLPAMRLERRIHPPRPSAGSMARVEVDIVNLGSRSAPVLAVVDEVEGTTGARLVAGPLPPGERHQLGYRLPTARRGPLTVGPLRSELIDPFGLARRRSTGAERQTVTVLPAIEAISVGPMGGGNQEPLAGLSTSAVTSSGIEDLATLRPYAVGDDLRRVHWPSSAHADDLLVRRDEERWQGHLTVFIDQRAGAISPNSFEQAVSAAASIVHAVAQAGDRIRVASSTGWDTGMVDARRSEPSLLEELALITQDEEEHLNLPVGDGRRRSALVVLTGGSSSPLFESAAFDPVIVVGAADVATAGPDGAHQATLLPGRPFVETWTQAISSASARQRAAR